MNDKRLLYILGLQAVIIVLLGVLVVIQYETLQHIPRPVTLATIRETKDQTERIKLIQSLPMVRVHDVAGTVDVEVQNTPLAVQSYQ